MKSRFQNNEIYITEQKIHIRKKISQNEVRYLQVLQNYSGQRLVL